MREGFLAFAVPLKRHRDQKVKGTIYYHTDESLDAFVKEALDAIEVLKGTDRCFSFKCMYGSDPSTIVAIHFFGNRTPTVILRRVPGNARVLEFVAKKVGMIYRGEATATFGENLRLHGLKQRHVIPAHIRATVLQHPCTGCEEPSSEIDHIVPVSEGGTNAMDNLQAMCETCHAAKTRQERLSTYTRAGYSELSTDTVEAIVAAPKPYQLVFGDGVEGIELDNVNSRRWAVQKTTVKLPVACVLDKITPFDPNAEHTDLIFVDAGPADVTNYANFAAYHGPHWYPPEFARFLIDAEVKNGEGAKISTDNFIAAFTTHAHMQPSEVSQMYENMETMIDEAFDGDMGDLFAPDAQKQAEIAGFKKELFLAMQGSWLTARQFSWGVTDTTTPDDVGGKIESFTELDNGINSYKTISETLGNQTMFLFGLYALNMEQLNVCKGIRIASQMGYQIHGVLVDGVIISGGRRTDLEKATNAWKRPDGSNILRLKKDKATGCIAHKYAPQNAPLQKPIIAIASTWRSEDYTMKGDSTQMLLPRGEGQAVFQVATPSPWGNMGAFGSWLFEPRFVFQRVWTDMSEEPGIGDCTEQDTYQEEVAEAAFQNGGALVLGGGGAGKSHTIKLLKAKFEAIGVRVDVVGFTHVQAVNIGGHTLIHDLHTNALRKRRALIIDEGGQVPIHLWSTISTFKFTGSRIFVFGDFAGQLPPIADQHRLDLWKTIPTSDFMHDLCGGLRVTIQKFRRWKTTETDISYDTADYEHFRFGQSITPSLTGPEELLGAAELARKRYPIFRKEDEYATTLTLTNAARMVINARKNKNLAPPGAIHVPYKGVVESAQSIIVWPGIVLQSAVTTSSATLTLKNALRYRVRSVTANLTEIVQIDDKDMEDLTKIYTMPTKDLSAKMRLTFAITYDSSQSRTLHGGVRLTQILHPRMTLRRLITGLGRAPKGEDVEVE